MPATTPRQQPFPDTDNKKSKEESNGYRQPTFVRCDLSSDQKAQMAEWANRSSSDDLFELLSVSIQENYQLSVKPLDVGYQASLTQTRPVSTTNANGGKCLVTRASTPERAIWSLYFKHTQLLKKNWSGASQTQEFEW
jgi:hypothetical protein